MYKIRFSRFLSIILLAIALVASPAMHVSAGAVLTVTMVNEGSDMTPGDGLCAVSGGGCSLRAAIEEANAHAGADTIVFSLPGVGMHVMSITTAALPIITEQLTLDGTSQPSCTVPCIVLGGASLGGSNNGVSVYTNDSIIQGFVITSWSNYGISIVGNGNIIQSNDIGFWPGDPAPLPNGSGISIQGANNLIGGTLAGDRNVVSGNTGEGVRVGNGCCLSTNANVVKGNYIGTNETGTAALGNATGVYVSQTASNTIIGGTTASARNVVSGNLAFGIIVNGAAGTVIQGNYIGTNAAGSGALGNHEDGILINFGARLTQVGGTASGAGNRIAFNGWNGVNVTSATTARNLIRRNSIYRNTILGIDLGFDGVTANDTLDPDTGPNGLQNYPVITSATSATRVIVGQLRSKANQTYAVEFFSTTAAIGCSTSHFGEGRTFLGSANVTTNATGVASFTIAVPVAFPVGSIITATATDSLRNTSEFSRCRIAN
jgi:hypothetical protein